jgi:2-polyprenyl-3-methyl-5-hydroxy-6-metoxy-1,4-benzoquinol methylase
MPGDHVVRAKPATWPLRMADDVSAAEVERVRAAVNQASEASDWGWGHTVDFGPFEQPGLLKSRYLDFVGALDDYGWWPQRLDGRTIADVGAFTGTVSAIMAHRGAERVYAVDELEGHVQQIGVVADAFGLGAVEPVLSSLYALPERLGPGSVDMVLCAGVLYHCSDMLVAMIALQELLEPGGVLLLETNAVPELERSYANFGRFVAGMWWQPTAACMADLCTYAGFETPDIRFYHAGRALLRATKPCQPTVIPFRRGMNWTFEDIHDATVRGMDPAALAPAPLDGSPATPGAAPAATTTSTTTVELAAELARRASASARRRGRTAARRLRRLASEHRRT